MKLEAREAFPSVLEAAAQPFGVGYPFQEPALLMDDHHLSLVKKNVPLQASQGHLEGPNHQIASVGVLASRFFAIVSISAEFPGSSPATGSP